MLPDSLELPSNKIKLKGKFYTRNGVSRDVSAEHPLPKARVFKYSSWEIIQPYSVLKDSSGIPVRVLIE